MQFYNNEDFNCSGSEIAFESNLKFRSVLLFGDIEIFYEIFEISYCLPLWLGVNSKCLFVNTRATYEYFCEGFVSLSIPRTIIYYYIFGD